MRVSSSFSETWAVNSDKNSQKRSRGLQSHTTEWPWAFYGKQVEILYRLTSLTLEFTTGLENIKIQSSFRKLYGSWRLLSARKVGARIMSISTMDVDGSPLTVPLFWRSQQHSCLNEREFLFPELLVWVVDAMWSFMMLLRSLLALLSIQAFYRSFYDHSSHQAFKSMSVVS